MKKSTYPTPIVGTFGTRVASLVALVAMTGGIASAANVGYRLATDSFVAPITLSPESDMVITSNLKLNEIFAERAKMVAERERIDSELVASEHALERLTVLQKSTGNAMAWTDAVTAEQTRAGQGDLRTLKDRERNVREMQAKQDALVAEMERNLAAGLVSKADVVREAQVASQLRLAALDTERARIATEVQVHQLSLARRSLGAATHANAAASPVMPEMLAQQSQSIHLELEMVKLEAERRAAAAKREAIVAEISKIDEITAQMRARPLYRAIEARTHVAFVPYTQMKGVGPNAEVHECLWGLVRCKVVGTVSELLPGEVVMPDPWGAQARGQYAVLSLPDGESSKAKVLRVRGSAALEASAQKAQVEKVSAR